jgi:hypothetical protein
MNIKIFLRLSIFLEALKELDELVFLEIIKKMCIYLENYLARRHMHGVWI